MRSGDTPFPLKENGEIDKVEIRRIYDKSEKIQWKAFCEEVGYDQEYSYRHLAVQTWVREKRYRIAQERASDLQEMLDEVRPKITKDILKTIRAYPEAHDELLKLLNNTRIVLNNEMAEYVKSLAEAKQQGREPPQLRKGFVGDLCSLTMAITQCSASKYRSLLLNNASLQLTQEKIEQEANIGGEEAKQTGNPLTFEVIGFENADPKDLDALFKRYVDQPRPKELTDESN